MRYPHFPGTAERLRLALIEAGYVDAQGGPDVPRFIREKHYDPRVFYTWVNVKKPRTPSGSYLSRLCADLGTRIEWLLLGVRAGVVAFIIGSLTLGPGVAQARDTGAADSDTRHSVKLRRLRDRLRHYQWQRAHGRRPFDAGQVFRLVTRRGACVPWPDGGGRATA